MNKAMPSIEYLRECFDMSESGLLTWKNRPSHHFANETAARRWNSTYAGNPVGHVGKDGYMVVTLLEHRYCDSDCATDFTERQRMDKINRRYRGG